MNATERHNALMLGDLERRSRLLAAVFYGGLAAIPLGVVCPCGLAAFVYRIAPEWSQSVALSSFFLPLVGLAAALLVVGSRSRCKRSIALARLADSLGLRFTPQPPNDRLDFLAPFPVLNLLKVPHSGQGANLIEGAYKRRPLTAVDATTLHLLGYKHFVRRQTAAVFTEGFEALPAFAVVPRTWADRLEEVLLGTPLENTFEIPGEREWNRCFAVAGTDRRRILNCLTPEILDVFLEDKRLAVEVHEGRLLVYRRETVVHAEEYETFLLQANRIADEFGERGLSPDGRLRR